METLRLIEEKDLMFREKKVLLLLKEGKTYNQMARELHYSVGTIEQIAYRLRQKYGCQNSRELIDLAHRSHFFTDQNPKEA